MSGGSVRRLNIFPQTLFEASVNTALYPSTGWEKSQKQAFRFILSFAQIATTPQHGTSKSKNKNFECRGLHNA